MDEAGLDAVSVAAAGAAVSNGILYCFGGGSKNIQFQGTVYDYVQIYRPVGEASSRRSRSYTRNRVCASFEEGVKRSLSPGS